MYRDNKKTYEKKEREHKRSVVYVALKSIIVGINIEDKEIVRGVIIRYA